MEMHNFLKKYRINAGYTRKDMAYLTGIKERTIASYESDNEANRRSPSDEYMKAVSSILGVASCITDSRDLKLLDEGIDDSCFIYIPFTLALNKFLYFAKMTETELYLLLQNVELEDIRKMMNLVYFDFVIMLGQEQNFVETEKKKYNFSVHILKLAKDIILGINGIKTSDFGFSLDDYIDVVSRDEFHELSKLDKYGIPLTKEGVTKYIEANKNLKRSIIGNVLLDEEEKELIDLWRMASYPLQQSILESLRQVREHDLKITREILELAEKHNAPKEEE